MFFYDATIFLKCFSVIFCRIFDILVKGFQSHFSWVKISLNFEDPTLVFLDLKTDKVAPIRHSAWKSKVGMTEFHSEF